MRKALPPILALLALVACSETPVEPVMNVGPEFAVNQTVSSAGGLLRFADGSSVRISAQSRCTDVCDVIGSVDLNIAGLDRIRFDVADLQVTTGDLIPSSVTAASFAPNQFLEAGDYQMTLTENQPRDCEGSCQATWTIDVSEVVCGGPEVRVCVLTPLYSQAGGTGRLGLS